jgi:hypothetical protein
MPYSGRELPGFIVLSNITIRIDNPDFLGYLFSQIERESLNHLNRINYFRPVWPQEIILQYISELIVSIKTISILFGILNHNNSYRRL